MKTKFNVIVGRGLKLLKGVTISLYYVFLPNRKIQIYIVKKYLI